MLAAKPGDERAPLLGLALKGSPEHMAEQCRRFSSDECLPGLAHGLEGTRSLLYAAHVCAAHAPAADPMQHLHKGPSVTLQAPGGGGQVSHRRPAMPLID
jgi:hypothetical protein